MSIKIKNVCTCNTVCENLIKITNIGIESFNTDSNDSASTITSSKGRSIGKVYKLCGEFEGITDPSIIHDTILKLKGFQGNIWKLSQELSTSNVSTDWFSCMVFIWLSKTN